MASKTVRKLITQAYKLIGKASEHQNLTSAQIKDGLDALNDRLDHFGSVSNYIAFAQSITFPLVIGQETYELSNEVGADVVTNRLIEVDIVTLNVTGTEYPVKILDDKFYYGAVRDSAESGRPENVFLQNDTLSSFLTFFKKPDVAYTCFVKGKFVLSNLVLSDNLNELPQYYNEFLKYDLAKILKDSYEGNSWSQMKEAHYQQLSDDIFKMNDIPLTIDTSVALGSGSHVTRNIGVIV